ncbi:MAG: holo-ACP synthase [Coriobacteriia bacterium]|nr:holo-ACP synthase [Coriobacteriia bacterium]
MSDVDVSAAAGAAAGAADAAAAGAVARTAAASTADAAAPSAAGAASYLDGQVGLGLDVVQIARIAKVLERTPSFAQRVFTEGEREYCLSRSNPATHFATRFAAKEAVVKALGTGFSGGIRPRDIEVKRTTKGRPYVQLHGRAKEVAAEQGVRELPVSLSYTHEEAVACAMAITEESERARERRKDPMAELGKQFKEARSLLD